MPAAFRPTHPKAVGQLMSMDDSILTRQMRFLIDELNAPIGTMLLVVDLQGNLRAVDWKDHLSRMLRLLRIHYGDGGFALEACHDPAGMTDAMARYFEGDLSAIDRLQVQTRGTPFQREVWRALRTIPCGTTTSYRQLAEQIGRSAAVRAVGMANGSNPVGIVVPCHRVIGTNGSMTGYGGGIHRKLWLLEHERQHRHRTSRRT